MTFQVKVNILNYIIVNEKYTISIMTKSIIFGKICAATHSQLLSVAGAKLWVSGASLGLFDQTLGSLGQASLDILDRLRCEHCHREMKNEHSLNVHISRYHNQDCAPVQTICPVCSKTYSNQYSLRTHMHLQAAHHNNFYF